MNGYDLTYKQYKNLQSKVFKRLKTCKYIKYDNGDGPVIFKIKKVQSSKEGCIYIDYEDTRLQTCLNFRLFGAEFDDLALKIFDWENKENYSYYF